MPSRTTRLPPKATKASVNYSSAHGRADHCAVCQHFRRPDRCARVEGAIRPGDWCRLFLPAPGHAEAALTTPRE